MKVGAFNQERVLVVGAFSVIVKTDGSFAALAMMCRGWMPTGTTAITGMKGGPPMISAGLFYFSSHKKRETFMALGGHQ